MHITSVDIQNYRRFEHFHCDLDSRVTLLMGPNGAGKTSLLKAIFAGLDMVSNMAGLRSDVGDSDVRCVDTFDPANERWRTPTYPARVALDLNLDFQVIEVGLERLANTSWMWLPSGSDSYKASDIGSYFVNQGTQWFDPSNTRSIPLFARFGASHSWNGNARPESIRKPFETKQQIWQRAQSDAVDLNGLAQWFQYNELRALQEQQQPLIYRLAREAVLSAIHAEDINYIVRDNQLMVKHADHGWRPFEQLSDGQRRIAAIFCELAIRCASLNSHLGEDCIRETSGIVTIDELDLHLHPTWQRGIIGDLLRVFPKLQFIVASHSPFLLQAAFEYGKVLDVSTGEFVQPGDPSIEDIAENVMGVEQPQRSRRFLDMKELAQDYLELLETPSHTPEQKAVLKQQLDEALAVFANDPAAAAWLEQRRAAKGL